MKLDQQVQQVPQARKEIQVPLAQLVRQVQGVKRVQLVLTVRQVQQAQLVQQARKETQVPLAQQEQLVRQVQEVKRVQLVLTVR